MKTKIFGIVLLAVFFCHWGSALAVERNFSAGSLIIPMDSFYQSDDDGGILEAYGLVYYLLSHQDQTCLTGCAADEACRAACEHDLTVYWIINEDKTTIDGADFVIEDLTLAAGEVVAALYDHAGGTSSITFRSGDSQQRITYLGAPWIVEAADAAKARAIINQSGWSAVDVHVAQVPFKAPVNRELKGTPPRIALMNSSESTTGGNATILESYLRLAGICTDVYDVVTPNQIRDGILSTEGYDFLWAPHWHAGDDDQNGNGILDVEEIVGNIGLFLREGNGLLAECACIKSFEQYGRFLTSLDIQHNGGTNKAEDIIYNDKSTPYSQIGDFVYEPEGGSLHNWRPYDTPAEYNDTVNRFTYDNTGWDYYVGGYAFGDRDNGYAVYLGGHSYASCGGGSGDVEVDPEPNIHTFEFEFTKDISNEVFTLVVNYDSGSSAQITFSQVDLGVLFTSPLDTLQIDLTTAEVDGKKLAEVTFKNTGTATLTIDSITFWWVGGAPDQKLKKITDNKTDVKHYDKPEVVSGVELAMTDLTIAAVDPAILPVGCTLNDDCSWKNIAAVRYVLNTLFNIKYQLSSQEYLRAAPIVSHPYLYQGTFEYPSYRGHFRRYDVTRDSEHALWDTAGGRILPARDDNSQWLARQVFTAQQNMDGTWSKVGFDVLNIATLRDAMDMTPENGDDSDEIQVINRIRGKTYNSQTGQWAETANKLGGIMHSAPVIVGSKSRVGNYRSEMAYVGDLYGMLHAIETAYGLEKWAFIPSNLLAKLQNNRTDPNAVQDFAAVDASATARDVYFDHDNDGYKQWRTVLVCSEGFGGNSIFALDVSDPDYWSVLWETTDTAAPGGGMGHAYSVAIDKVKWPLLDVDDSDNDGDLTEILGHEMKWVVFVATGYARIAVDHGGINVFAFDLQTGTKLWHFSAEYDDAVNDIPGAATAFDIDGDTFVDRVYVGDMNGRMWEIDALDGTNPNGTEESGDDAGKQIPLFNAGIGNPISVSPAIMNKNDHTILVFGTGGANWASDSQSYAIYAVNATDKQATPSYANGAGTLLWQMDLSQGEKVWSTPTIANGQIFAATAFGGMEASDPRTDIAAEGLPTGNLHKIDLIEGTLAWSISDIGKVRGSIYVDRQHVYLSTIDNRIIQIGGDNFAAGTGDRVIMRSWKQF